MSPFFNLTTAISDTVTCNPSYIRPCIIKSNDSEQSFQSFPFIICELRLKDKSMPF